MSSRGQGPRSPCGPAASEQDYRALLDEIGAEFPGFQLVRKRDALLQRTIDVALRLVTLGGQHRYLTGYVTTIGRRVYLPSGWSARRPAERIATLRHERVHLRQFRRWGLPLMAIAYLVLPVPLGFAWFRMRLEREAYEESIRALWELEGPLAVLEPRYRRYVVGEFTGPGYGWMWLWRPTIERWFDAVVGRLIDEHGLPDDGI